jgi:hypothetical protein
MSHIRANSRLGQAFRININYLQLTSGQTKPIFESNSTIDYILPIWLLHLRDYLIEINATMKIKNVWQISLLRYNDVEVMDEVRSNPKRDMNVQKLKVILSGKLPIRDIQHGRYKNCEVLYDISNCRHLSPQI